MGRYTQVVLDTCAYAGTGNVLKVQEMLHLCAEHLDDKAEHQVGGGGCRWGGLGGEGSRACVLIKNPARA